jgi:hypothetical protein
LVCLRTSSSVNRPFSLIALTMVPLHTPLQPHTSALSGIAGGLALALVADVAQVVLAEHQVVADVGMSCLSLSSWKYQAPSAVSP